MATWIATSYGALDLRRHDLAQEGFEAIVTPSTPGSPRFLFGQGAELWRRLVMSPLDDDDVDEQSQSMLREFAELGIASRIRKGGSSIERLDSPWLLSVVHELVYALLANVAAENGIEILFIKGPTLHAQGLRDREHSGDVDCWVRPGDDLRLARAMTDWGWTPLYSAFTGTGVPHSMTLRAGEWGCAIDVHSRFPGMDVDPEVAFELVRNRAELRSFAGMVVHTPDKAVHAVIAALHEVRPYLGAQPTRQQVEAARTALEAGGVDVIGVVEAVRASYVLDEPLRAAFPHTTLPPRTHPAPADWGWRSTPIGPRRYLKALRLVPLRHRPAVLRRLLWPSAETLRIAYETPEASVWTLSRMRARRIVRSIAGYFRGDS